MLRITLLLALVILLSNLLDLVQLQRLKAQLKGFQVFLVDFLGNSIIFQFIFETIFHFPLQLTLIKQSQLKILIVKLLDISPFHIHQLAQLFGGKIPDTFDMVGTALLFILSPDKFMHFHKELTSPSMSSE
jgi:hypothetical protein